ncbi:MAG: YraN family protein [Elusimicrobia bacterium]|nr:YraN family protein [Elusimicrobiota bacterium]
MSNTSRGLEAERQAAAFLENLGMRILERRYRSPLGEIDLVAKDGETVVFVEVKARRSLAFGLPEEAVGFAKQRRLARAAEAYLALRGLDASPARFDVVAITPAGIRHLADAFRAS